MGGEDKSAEVDGAQASLTAEEAARQAHDQGRREAVEQDVGGVVGRRVQSEHGEGQPEGEHRQRAVGAVRRRRVQVDAPEVVTHQLRQRRPLHRVAVLQYRSPVSHTPINYISYVIIIAFHSLWF